MTRLSLGELARLVNGRAPADDENAIIDAIDRSVRVIPDFLAGRAGEAMKTLHARDRAT